MISGEQPDPQSNREFRTTHWSLVREAGTGTDRGHSALESLCRTYWYPLYVFVRRRGHEPHQAQDLTQEFFARLLASEALQAVQPDKGRFRTFLLAALKNFLANEWRDANRQKRGGGREFISLDEFATEEHGQFEWADAVEPEVVYDRRWAQRLVTASLLRLETEMARDGLAERCAALKPFLQGEGGAGSYATVAAKLGLSEPAVKSVIFRLRRRYADILREEVSQTVASAEDVEAEIRHLITVLAAH